MSQMAERRVSHLDAEETLRNPDRAYRSRQGRTVAEKAFEGYVVRVVYIVEDAPVAMEKHDRAMEKLHPGYLESIEIEGFEEVLAAPRAERDEAGRATREDRIATVVTVVKMRRKTRTGNGSP
jgi:hypothetical protein